MLPEDSYLMENYNMEEAHISALLLVVDVNNSGVNIYCLLVLQKAQLDTALCAVGSMREVVRREHMAL